MARVSRRTQALGRVVLFMHSKLQIITIHSQRGKILTCGVILKRLFPHRHAPKRWHCQLYCTVLGTGPQSLEYQDMSRGSALEPAAVNSGSLALVELSLLSCSIAVLRFWHAPVVSQPVSGSRWCLSWQLGNSWELLGDRVLTCCNDPLDSANGGQLCYVVPGTHRPRPGLPSRLHTSSI
jgi:hypothetical protein